MRSLLVGFYSLWFAGCVTLGPKPEVVYHRADLKTKTKKVIVFPTTDFTGKKSPGAQDIDKVVVAGWTNLYGAKNVIPAGPVLEQLTKVGGKDTYSKLISSLDNVSAVEQLHKNEEVRKLIGEITSKLGNYNFSLAIVNGGKQEFDQKQPVRIHLGYFDSENLTWRWITKIEDTKGTIGDWRATSNMMVNNSFDIAAKLEKGEKI